MPEMKINGMSLEAYSDHMKEKHGHKKNLETLGIKKRRNNKLASQGFITHIPAPFEEVLKNHLVHAALIRSLGR